MKTFLRRNQRDEGQFCKKQGKHPSGVRDSMCKCPEVECGWNIVSEGRGPRVKLRDAGSSAALVPVSWILFEVGWEAFEGLGWGKGSDMIHEFEECSGSPMV